VSTPADAEAQEKNVEFLRRYLSRLNDGGLPAIANETETYIHPEIEWTPGLMSLGKQTYRGRAEFRAYIDEAAERGGTGGNRGFLNLDEIRAVGEDRVLALGWVHHVGADGDTLDNDYALLVRIEDGSIRWMQSFLSRDEAERAAGDA
jgi:ketosteroid isomerase-like protein